MSQGFRVLEIGRRLPRALLERLNRLPVANISDSMSRMSAGGPRLRPMHGPGRLCGPAITVKTRPGDNLMVHKAIDMAAPGDVIVVDAAGDLTTAIIGDIMLTYAMKRGISGFVINGAVRDIATIQQAGLPVYAAGITHRGPYKDGPGEVNTPISIDGMVICPGDAIVGDADGVLAIPFDAIEAVLLAAESKFAAEAQDFETIEAGTWSRAWVDDTLRARGCEMPNSLINKGSKP